MNASNYIRGVKMPESEEIEKLANSLRSSGLAASDLDAVNKAKEILGYNNKGVNIRVNQENKQEQPSSIETKPPEKTIVQKTKSQEDLFSDPSFSIAKTNISINQAVGGEVMTNDPETLEKEKQAEELEKSIEDKQESNEQQTMIMTNEELSQQKEEQAKLPTTTE